MSQVSILVAFIDVSSVQFNLIIDNGQCHHSDKSREEQVHHNHLQHHHHHGGQCHWWGGARTLGDIFPPTQMKSPMCVLLPNITSNTIAKRHRIEHTAVHDNDVFVQVAKKRARQPYVQYLQLLVLHH